MSLTSTGAFDLSPKKQALLQALLKAENIDPLGSQKISSRDDKTVIPLSFAQYRLWFLEQLRPNTSIHTIPGAFRIKGKLYLAALQASFETILRRHEALRIVFPTTAGKPAPKITTIPSTQDTLSPHRLSVIDLQDIPAAEQEEVAQQQAISELQKPFNLAQGPLVRTTLLRLDEDEHIFLIALHHIVADGWSLGLLMRELAALYQTFCVQTLNPRSAAPVPLPDLPIQYADFAHWQRQWLQGDVLAEQLSYWKQQLSGDLPVLQLPADYPRPATQTFQGKFQAVVLPPTLSGDIKALARSEKATLYMTLLAAFKVLLYRYTAQEDILVGSPITNRNRPEIEGLIGVFVNTLVMRTSLDGDLSFRELLGRVREVVVEANAHPDLPFEKLVDELQLERDMNHSPLFQVMFVLQNAPAERLTFSDLILEPILLDKGTAQFDLTLDITETTESINCRFEYNTDLFSDATIARMMRHFQTLLAGIVIDCEQRISELPLLTAAEQQQFQVEWNRTQANYPRQACLHHLFTAQVEQTPDAVAVVFDQEQLTYQELNQRANQLAHHLQTLGVKPDVLVGVLVERSLDMIIGLLGVLKAGGAYVPLDPIYPQERLAFMLSDAQIPVLLTQQALLKQLPEHGASVICLDADWEIIDTNRTDNTVSSVGSDHLAYVIYTSGSTGNPKGVQIPHSAVVNFLMSMMREPGLTQSDALLAVTSISFDIAALELYLPLITGARLILARHDVTQDGRLLAEQLNASGATVMQATPASWRMLLSSGWSGNTDLKILCGGEALSRDLAELLLEKGTSLWNLYGPTETTIWSTVYKVESDLRSPTLVPIGHPIANTHVYLLSPSGQPSPIGIPGELHIGGAGLARGYLNRPELTAEKFIIHPLGERLYKTGDLARYRSDGAIEYIGRIDHQVKLRGFRIELGEIETVLRRHPSIDQAVVVASVGESGHKRLVAYIVGLLPVTTLTDDLRGYLEQKLPRYMTPSVFVKLETLPLTPNGKIDRRALPAPDDLTLKSKSAFVSPRTPVEKGLAEIWTQVLGVEQVGLHDNFFELGGDSILSIQIIYQANQLGFQLTPQQLFERQTIAQLAAVTRVSQTNQTHSMEVPEQTSTPIEPSPTGAKRYTPSDFPQAQLSQKDLNTLAKKLNDRHE